MKGMLNKENPFLCVHVIKINTKPLITTKTYNHNQLITTNTFHNI